MFTAFARLPDRILIKRIKENGGSFFSVPPEGVASCRTYFGIVGAILLTLVSTLVLALFAGYVLASGFQNNPDLLGLAVAMGLWGLILAFLWRAVLRSLSHTVIRTELGLVRIGLYWRGFVLDQRSYELRKVGRFSARPKFSDSVWDVPLGTVVFDYGRKIVEIVTTSEPEARLLAARLNRTTGR